MNSDIDSKMDRFTGFVLAVLALAVYLGTLSIGAYPGESANLIVQATGLFPRLNPLDPFWNGIAFLLSKLPVSGLAVKLNIFSAICGAFSVLLMYQIVSKTIFNTISVNPVNKEKAVTASRLAGVVSAIFLAFCIPFWIVSNRAHPASFHVLLLLGITRLFIKFIDTRSVKILILFSFIYGLAVVEFATLILFIPLFGFYLLFDLWKKEELSTRPVLLALLSGTVGLLMYFVAAFFFYGSEGYVMREYSNYFQIIWFMWRDQYFLITRSLPRIGWLIVLILTTIPWLTCITIAGRALNEERDWTYYILHAVMTGLALCVLLNASFAPWSMFKSGRLLVTPYVLTASVFGYLVAYWYLLPSGLWSNSESPGLIRLGERLGIFLIIPLFVLAGVAPVMNIDQATGKGSSFINMYAEDVLKCLLPEQKWLVTDGMLANHLMIAARDRGRTLQILNIRRGDNEPYMKYVAKQFERPRLMNLAKTGMFPLLQEWMQTDPDVTNKLAVMWPCDLWVGAGYSVVPRGLVFNGVQNIRMLDVNTLLEENRRIWTRLVPLLVPFSDNSVLSYYARHLLRNTSLLAVNLGCVMEDLGKNDDAFSLYHEARDMCPDNISALLNLSTMVVKGYKTDQAESIRNSMKALLSRDYSKRPDIWTLSRAYGYVRTPEAFARLGLVWAFSGQPGAAIVGLKKAMDLLPGDKKGAVKQVLADVYLVQEHDEDSETLYYELLVENPGNHRALMGMARILARKHEFKQAVEYLKKAEIAGVPRSSVTVEMALFNLMAGNLAQARIGLEEVVDLKPEGIGAANVKRAWLMLMGIYTQQRDLTALQECIKRIQENKVLSSSLLLVAKGHLGLVRNNIVDARNNFEASLRAMPNNLSVLELLVRLDVAESRKKEAEVHVKRLLKLDPNNALGNYIRGSLQFHDREYSLAEDSYRKSLERRKSPETMNDLAWVLNVMGEYDEAEKMARGSIELNDKNYAAWDTLGVILMKINKLDEAEKAIEHGMSMAPDMMSLVVHMAQLQVLRGNKEKAINLIATISGKQGNLPEDSYREFENLKKALNNM
ncbi:MAG: DUF2723 domain-containing protein [Kiritimatiellae bacterium]|nr:DUF2723 domain-containing protein [Kiritimatiellia bacterium]